MANSDCTLELKGSFRPSSDYKKKICPNCIAPSGKTSDCKMTRFDCKQTSSIDENICTSELGTSVYTKNVYSESSSHDSKKTSSNCALASSMSSNNMWDVQRPCVPSVSDDDVPSPHKIEKSPLIFRLGHTQPVTDEPPPREEEQDQCDSFLTVDESGQGSHDISLRDNEEIFADKESDDDVAEVQGLPPEEDTELQGDQEDHEVHGFPPEEELKGDQENHEVQGLPPEEELQSDQEDHEVQGLPPEEELHGDQEDHEVQGLPPEEELHGDQEDHNGGNFIGADEQILNNQAQIHVGRELFLFIELILWVLLRLGSFIVRVLTKSYEKCFDISLSTNQWRILTNAVEQRGHLQTVKHLLYIWINKLLEIFSTLAFFLGFVIYYLAEWIDYLQWKLVYLRQSLRRFQIIMEDLVWRFRNDLLLIRFIMVPV